MAPKATAMEMSLMRAPFFAKPASKAPNNTNTPRRNVTSKPMRTYPSTRQ